MIIALHLKKLDSDLLLSNSAFILVHLLLLLLPHIGQYEYLAHILLGMGASLLLPRLISSQLASYYLATGRTVTGTEAASDGLVLKAVPEVSTARSLNAKIIISIE